MGFDLDWCDGGHARKTIRARMYVGLWAGICSNLSYLMNKYCCFFAVVWGFFSLLMVSTEITTTTKWFWLRSKFAWPNFKFGQFLLLCSFLKIHSISLAHSAGIVRLLLLWFFELTLWLNIQMLSQNTENIKKTGVSSEETRKMFYRWCNLVELVQSSLPNIF